MKTIALALLLTVASRSAYADALVRYFELKTKGLELHVTLLVDGESVVGTEFSGNGEPDTDAGFGQITGKVRQDGLLHVTYNYHIEGYQQSEEQLLRLDGRTLYIGEGELEEHGPGQMVLKDPKKVKFERALKEFDVRDFDAASKDASTFTKVLQEPMAKLIGAAVVFSGTVRVSQKWARYEGGLAVEDGKTAKDAATGKALQSASVRAYFKQDDKGDWKLVRYMFEDAPNLEVPADGQDYDSIPPWALDEDMP